MSSINLHYDGTLEDLKLEVNNIKKMFGNYSPYRSSIKEIESDIYNNFDKWKDYSLIFVGKIKLMNYKAKSSSIAIHSTDEDLKPENKPLYGWDYTVFLLTILLILVIMFIFICLYCYLYNIDIIMYFNSNMILSC